MAENTAMSETSAPIRVDVTQAQHIYGGVDQPDTYKNESTPRGFAFIANMISFVNDVHKQREGSDVDVRNLKELFEQMGYLVQEHHNLSREGLRNALKTLSEETRLATMDSLVVIIMSHGVGESHVVTADGRKIKDTDIFEYFNNLNCPDLHGKPKIFILQFCRGDLPDVGVAHPSNEFQDRAVAMDGPAQGGTHSIQKMPSFSDFYTIYATVRGYVAYRDQIKGSWLIDSLCQVFMEHAHDTRLHDLVSKLSGRVSARQSSRGWVQVPEIRHFGFVKLFYFNPVHINQLELRNTLFPALPYFSELQSSDSGLTRSAQRGHVTLARDDFQSGVYFKRAVVRRVREENLVYWLTMVKEEVRFGKLTLDGQYYVLHSLSHHSREDISQGVTRVRDLVPYHYDGMDAFLLLGADPAGPQPTIRVRLQPRHPRTAQFAHLCTGERGPTYKGAEMDDERGKKVYGFSSCLFSVYNYIENGSEKKGRIETISGCGVKRDCEPGEVVLIGWPDGSFGLGKITKRRSLYSIVGVVTSPSLSDLESFNVEGSPIKIIDCGLCVPI